MYIIQLLYLVPLQQPSIQTVSLKGIDRPCRSSWACMEPPSSHEGPVFEAAAKGLHERRKLPKLDLHDPF